jgi:glycerate dehydrogenase
MNIVVLDGHTLNPGDLSWDGLKALGSCVIHERTAGPEIVPRMADAEMAITNKVPFTRETLLALPKLRYVGVTATGYNIIDTTTAQERGVTVTNVPTYGTRSVAQHTLALLLELTQHAGQHSESARSGKWARSPDWCYWEKPLVELDGLTMGIVGLGRIGRAVSDLAQAFGMKVIAAISPRAKEIPHNVSIVDLDYLFRSSDVVSLHCPLTNDTRHLVDATRLSRMKPTAFLINTSRGPLVDEEALAGALKEGRIAGAGLDVLSSEPPAAGNPLLSAKNCIVTPHVAWATRAARARLLQATVENAQAFLAGKPRNVVGG